MNVLEKLGVCAVLAALFATAAAHAAAGDPVAGKDKSAACQGCHGEDGNSAAPSFPKLAGQYAAYIEKQIIDFQKERRSDPTMAPMAMMLAEKQDLKDVAAYFASQKVMAGSPAGKAEVIARGKTLYIEGNAASGMYGCVNCHGENGKGKSANNALFPIVGGQHKDYLVKTLTDFRSGGRSNDPAGMMAGIAQKMNDAEIEAVSEYLSGL